MDEPKRYGSPLAASRAVVPCGRNMGQGYACLAGSLCAACCALEWQATLLQRCRALLQRVQWLDGVYARDCPSCYQSEEHTPDCELAALLRELG